MKYTLLIALSCLIIFCLAVFMDTQKLDPKVLSAEYNSCVEKIPKSSDDGSYSQSLQACLSNARVIAHASAK